MSVISAEIDNHQAFTSLFCRKRLPLKPRNVAFYSAKDALLHAESMPFSVKNVPVIRAKAG
jgi:hypothetical protein